jgi:N-acetylglucosaminyl-diphospho-decaprenol L-rhamnosyltransferase
MDLSILIVNWNSKDYLARAIDAVVAGTRGLVYEVIVVDSGSFDGCAEMLLGSWPGVCFRQCSTNLGFARANNLAADMAHGRVLLFLNPDTEVTGNAIGLLHDWLLRLPTAGIVGPTLLNTDGSVQDTCVRAFPTVLNQVLDADLLRRRFPRAALWGKESLSTPREAPARVDAVSGACLMITREAFERAGRFSDDYFMYAEDMDLCLKVQRVGFGTWHVQAALVVHHGGGSSARAPVGTFAAVMALESQWRFFRKTRSASYAALYRVAMFGASVLRVGALLVAAPFEGLLGGNGSPRAALRKWSARLLWAVGGQRQVRRL